MEVEANQYGSEECDGINDARCPDRCVPPGETGPNGETECTCVRPGATCADATPLPNGTSSALTHGGWWTFTADTPAYAVETCGSTDWRGNIADTQLTLWTGACDSLELVAFNDDCNASTPLGDGSDPLASCYEWWDYPSCTCIPTNMGQQYWVQVEQPDPPYYATSGSTTNVTLSKRLECGAIWEGGACCDGYGNCRDDLLESECLAPADVWNAQKFCATVEPCDVTLGACCDAGPGLGGACTDGATADECTGTYQTFSLGAMCADVTCTEIRGACCNGFTGTCSQTLRTDCQGTSMVWAVDTPCADVTCEAVPGACCNHINPDPLAGTGVCTDGVLWADCQGDVTWTKGTSCSAVTCDATFQAIPAVSEWGLLVLALLMAIIGKLAFGRLWGQVLPVYTNGGCNQ